MLPGDSRTGDWVEFFDGDHEPDSHIKGPVMMTFE